MSELFVTLSSISLILIYWIFTALMINKTLTRKYSRKITVLAWILGIAGFVTITLYSLFVPKILLAVYDYGDFAFNLIQMSVSILSAIIVSLIIYRESLSSIFFVSSLFSLGGMIIFDIVVNIMRLIYPFEEYYSAPYLAVQIIICIAIMAVLLDFTYRKLADAIKNLIENLRGNLQDFMWASVMCTAVYVIMSMYFNTQTNSILDDSQIVPRVIFLILCFTMYLVIIFGVRRTITEIQLSDEMNLAKEIQVSILPDDDKLKEIPNLKIAAKMIPYNEVGGDFYDVFRLDDDKTAFLITDVAGKGIPAAMFMMRTKSFLKINMNYQKAAAPTLTFANRELLKNNDLCMFYTAVAGVYNSSTSVFSYSCGGHYAPVLIRDGKAVSCKIGSDPVIGVKDFEYNQFEVELKKDDVVFFYTDGSLDTLSPQGERYGTERLMNKLKGESDPDKIISDIISDLNKFCGRKNYADDLTLVAFKVL